VIWLTNRQVAPKTEYYEAKPIKINFFEEPYLAIELAYQRALMRGETPPQYLEVAREGLHPETGEWTNIPNRMAYVYGALLRAGLTPPNFRFKVKYIVGIQSEKIRILRINTTLMKKAIRMSFWKNRMKDRKFQKAPKRQATGIDRKEDNIANRIKIGSLDIYQILFCLSFFSTTTHAKQVGEFILSSGTRSDKWQGRYR
jgi:hypothetical protein